MPTVTVRTSPLVPDPTDCAAIKALLDAKIDAYNTATAGGSIRSVTDSDTSSIEYNAPNAQQLLKDIQLLQAQYQACIAGTAVPVMTKPINFLF
jgi:hypothetical protein